MARVGQTLKKYRQDGLQALTWKKPAGPACRLSQEQLAQLVAELDKGALAHGFEGQVWTRQRVNAVITKLFGISYDPSQVGRLLKQVGWSRQKPQPKAHQQDPLAVQAWQTDLLAALKKEQDESRVLIYIDESACYLLPLLSQTWAPKGQTPVLLEQAGRSHLSLIAAIAPTGRLYVSGQDQAFCSEDVLRFLARYRKRNLLVIWQGRLCGRCRHSS